MIKTESEIKLCIQMSFLQDYMKTDLCICQIICDGLIYKIKQQDFQSQE
jgi:hypothetical protein